jgi:hypothetical protein
MKPTNTAIVLLKILICTLAFDDAERNAVDEENNVRPPCLGRAGTLDIELLTNMEGVVSGIGPIDVFQGPPACVTLDRLIERRAKLQEIGRQFVQPHNAERLAAAQPLNRGLNVGFRERVLLSAILDGVKPHELGAKNVLQQHIRKLTAPFAVNLRLGQDHPFGRHCLQ